MKRIFAFLSAVVFTVSVFAQAPQKMSYQAVIRDANNNLVKNLSIGMRISILQGSASGTVVYMETQTPTTNVNGLISFEIGSGTGFNTIDWSNGSYFIKTETDPTGGTNYTITGTSQLLSVPYTLYSKTAQTANYNNLTNLPNLSSYLTTESDPMFGASPAHGIANSNITNWNTAWGWGNHATQGYLKSYSETDPVFISHPANGITTTLIGNWNVAYSWGNHAGLYRPITYVPTWTDVISKPTFATVATSGNYNDLNNKPTGNNIGDIQYWNGTIWVVVPVGQPGQFLQLTISGLPSWTGPTYPSLTTTTASAITSTTATSGGNVTSDGGATITARGVCWSTSSNPTVADNKTSDGTGIGTFISSLTSLTANTTYFLRSYATNSVGTTYGNQVTFSTSGVADIDGNVYKTVTLGTQTWMAENLKTTKYYDGTSIPLVNDGPTWGGLSTPAYCWYNNDAATYKNLYGALYNWYTVNTGKLCPSGWHVSTDSDWKTMEMFLGMTQAQADATGWRGINQGTQIKTTTGWITGGADPGTNTSGFSGQANGNREGGPGAFGGATEVAKWWTSTDNNSTEAWNRYLGTYNSACNGISRSSDPKVVGSGIRCVMN